MPVIDAVPLILAAALTSPTSTGERVVFCEKGAPCPQPNRSLGTSPRGSWVAVEDRVLLRGALPRVLYFTVAEYQEAVAGLSTKQREEAIRRRLETMSGDPTARSLGMVLDDIKRVAAATTESDKDFLSTIEAAIVLSGGANRFTSFSMRPTEALSQNREGLAPLLAELDGPSETAKGYRAEAELLSKVEVAPGGRRPPHASPVRAYFVPGTPASPRSDPSFVDMPSYGWRGGSVRALRPEEAASPPWKASKPRLLYYAKEPFLRDISTLTGAQIERRLRARLTGPPNGELSDWIATLAFKYAVSLRQYTEVVRRGKVPGLQVWNEAATADVQNLKRALAEADAHAPKERRARIETLRADITLAAAMIRDTPQAGTSVGWLSEVAAIAARLQD